MIELPIELFNQKLKESCGVDVMTPCKLMIDLSEIVAYRESVDDNIDQLTETCIYLRSGESFVVIMSYKEFKEIMLRHRSSRMKV